MSADCFTSIDAPIMSQLEYWSSIGEISTNDKQPQFPYQFQQFRPVQDAAEEIQTIRSQTPHTWQIRQQQSVGRFAEPSLLSHQLPQWNYGATSTQNKSTSAPTWPIAHPETWENPMISRGAMIQNTPNAQISLGNVKTQSLQIKNPVQNRPSGIVKNKRKRKRTAFTTDQILALEKIFSTQPYIDRTERQNISEKLSINERAVKIWFQNRRMKSKRDSLEDSDEQEDDMRGETFIAQNSPPSDINYIETQIQRTDQFGYVTLNENILGTLVQALDGILPANVELSVDSPPLAPVEITNVTTNVNIELTSEKVYEPISPAESNSDDLEWEPPQDKESLGKLFNLHFC